jgi:hypothetical protein
VQPVLVLRYSLRVVLAAARVAGLLDRTLFAGAALGLTRLPGTLGRTLSRVSSGSLTEYLLLVFTGLALLVLARLFA